MKLHFQPLKAIYYKFMKLKNLKMFKGVNQELDHAILDTFCQPSPIVILLGIKAYIVYCRHKNLDSSPQILTSFMDKPYLPILYNQIQSRQLTVFCFKIFKHPRHLFRSIFLGCEPNIKPSTFSFIQIVCFAKLCKKQTYFCNV